jgi:septal ring factor EnvC (AmiA/AmiB activator)
LPHGLGQKRFLWFVPLALLALGSAEARQEKHPATPSAADVKALEKQAAESRARAEALTKQTAALQKEVAAQHEAVTTAAAEVRTEEETLSRLEGERAALSADVDRQKALLDRDQGRLARLTAALTRLARLPPGALLTSFDAPVDAGRAQLLLSSAAGQARDGAAKAEQELARLDELTAQLAAKEHEGERQSAKLKTRQAALETLVEKRQALYERTDSDRKAEEERAQQMADQARDLRDLVARIEAEQQAEAQRKAHAKKPPPAGKFVAGVGLPVAGEVKTTFGQSDGLGTTSHGITILTRPGATVTTPSAGTVKFAGPFRGYRQILILEHPGGYLSLIAGMSRINAPLGAQVGAGEPVGTMDDRADSRPELYYELRRNGEFVDPQAVSLSVVVKGKVR